MTNQNKLHKLSRQHMLDLLRQAKDEHLIRKALSSLQQPLFSANLNFTDADWEKPDSTQQITCCTMTGELG